MLNKWEYRVEEIYCHGRPELQTYLNSLGEWELVSLNQRVGSDGRFRVGYWVVVTRRKAQRVKTPSS